jgi:hypothetical protein
VGLAFLRGAPGEVVEDFVVATRRGRLRLRAAVGEVSAEGPGSLEQEQEDEEHVALDAPV